MTAEPLPDGVRWIWPTTAGYTADDLDRLPDLPPHTELIDGTLVLVSPQKDFHTLTLDLLGQGLRRHAPPAEFRVRREMSVLLNQEQRPEPDLIVLRADAVGDTDRTYYPVDVVILAVEVVSPDSRARDRERKPQLYAKAGIPYFWRVEDVSGKIVVYAYELDPVTRLYAPVGIFHDRVKLSLPFAMEIDLTEIDRM
jgi:Uma2 family endonuclease